MNDTAYDMKKYLKTIYNYVDATNGNDIDIIKRIDDNILNMVDEVDSLINELGGNAKDIPLEYLVDAINEDGYFKSQLNSMVQNYEQIEKFAKAGLVLLKALKEMVE